MALLEAELPEGCTRTIYMCDDGKDPLKRDWVESLSDDVIYVSGPCPVRMQESASAVLGAVAVACHC